MKEAMTPKPQANTLEEQIAEAVMKYKRAGGNPEFYIISKSDHDRNWAKAVAEARIDELQNIRGRVEYIHSDSVTDRIIQLKENQ